MSDVEEDYGWGDQEDDILARKADQEDEVFIKCDLCECSETSASYKHNDSDLCESCFYALNIRGNHEDDG